jgi:hypothetical protein
MGFARLMAGLAVAALVAGCSAGDAAKVLTPTQSGPAVDPVTQAPVVQGACPKVDLREGTAYFTTYAKGGDKDPSKVVRQASITETTRQCRTDGTQLIMTVQASGRVVAGPAGGPGDIELPIRVVVTEGDTVLYSELQKQTVTLPQGEPTAQFLFTNSTVAIPASSSRTAKVMVGFDPGPYNTP